MKIEKEDYIYNTSWKKLCDESFDEDSSVLPLKNCVIYVPLDQIVRFFKVCRNTDYKYVVVSGNSDYSLCYQTEYPVQADLIKWLDFVDWKKEIVGYEDVIIKARCYKHQCKITDVYSLRFYSFTGHTFDEIPKNIVNWYSTNNNVWDAVSIPFGIPEWEEIKYTPFEDKRFSMYANFQINTSERLQVRRFLEANPQLPSTLIKEEIPHSDYYTRLTECQYTVCPEGNGFDCYRTLESIYSGCIPMILSNTDWSDVYGPVRSSYSEFFQNPLLCMDKADIDYKKCTLSYWKNIFEKERQDLNSAT